jgi:hypothetical protein
MKDALKDENIEPLLSFVPYGRRLHEGSRESHIEAYNRKPYAYTNNINWAAFSLYLARSIKKNGGIYSDYLKECQLNRVVALKLKYF